MQKSSKGQGALEYLLLIGGAVLVAVVIIVLIINMVPTTGDEINETIDAGQSEIDRAYQDALANGGGNEGDDTPPDDGGDEYEPWLSNWRITN